jgi:hypothetical protein
MTVTTVLNPSGGVFEKSARTTARGALCKRKKDSTAKAKQIHF